MAGSLSTIRFQCGLKFSVCCTYWICKFCIFDENNKTNLLNVYFIQTCIHRVSGFASLGTWSADPVNIPFHRKFWLHARHPLQPSRHFRIAESGRHQSQNVAKWVNLVSGPQSLMLVERFANCVELRWGFPVKGTYFRVSKGCRASGIYIYISHCSLDFHTTGNINHVPPIYYSIRQR